MTAVEMKYSIFKDIDSIHDEAILKRVAALVRSVLVTPKIAFLQTAEKDEIPEFVRRMSVQTTIPADFDAKDIMREHWTEKYD